jgi:hypothetical protein
MKYEAHGVWHNRSFATQRCDWYAVNKGTKTYAFHEWTFFPHFGEVMAAAIKHEQAKDRTEYWLEGWAQNAEDLVELIRSVGLDPGKYRAEECKYGPGVFPVCSEFSDAVKWFESTCEKRRKHENDQRPH